jgi:hypothetical protein
MLHVALGLMASIASAAPPAVSAGPDLAERAVPVEAPIHRVTVYSDRARIRREASLDLGAGVHAIRLPDLTGATMLDTLRLSISNARVHYLGASPIDRERLSIEQADVLIDKLESLTDELALLDAEKAVLDQELELLAQISPAPAVPEAQRMGRPLSTAAPDAWRHVLDFLDLRRSEARGRQRALEIDRRAKLEAVAALQSEVQRYDLGAFSDRRIQVLAIVESDGRGRVKLELEYFVPGASWTPAYDLRFASDRGQVAIETAGIVTQATGEDWNSVEIDLSTAIPGQGIELPEMLTWTLGEAKDFVPVAHAGRAPQASSPPPPATVPQADGHEAELAVRRRVLEERLAELATDARTDVVARVAVRKKELALSPPTDQDKAEAHEESGRGQQMLAAARSASQRTAALLNQVRQMHDVVRLNCVNDKSAAIQGLVSVAEQAAASLDQEAAQGERSAASRESVRLQIAANKAQQLAMEASQCIGQLAFSSEQVLSADVSRAQPTTPPPAAPGAEVLATHSRPASRSGGGLISGIFSSGSADSGPRYKNTPLGLFEPEYWNAPRFQNPALPAVTAGGLDYVYPAIARATIPSNGQKLKVPLASESYPVSAYYESTPSIEPTAYLKATVTNKSERPVLLGPATIFSGEEFVGEGTLRTTGPGGAIDFPLGADQDVRVARKLIQQTATEGFFSKDDTTTYRVIIEVANYKKKSIRIGLIEPLPKTRSEKVNIALASSSPKPSKGPDEDGVVRWDLEIAAGKTSSVQLEYRIKRPARWELYE